MIKRLVSFSILLLSSLFCYSQASYTNVTATLQDSSLQTWANATVIATLRPAPNNPFPPLNNGLPITDSPQTVVADGSGTFNLTLDDTSHITPAGATWIFNIYPNATVQNGSSIILPVTGASQNFSGVLSSILTPPSVFAAPSINRAYNDSQVNGGTGGIYWNTTSNIIRGCVLSAGICNWITIGSIGVPGNHFYIPYNNGGGAFTASANLQFNDSTNTFSTVNGIFSGTLNISSTLGVSGVTTTAGLTTTGQTPVKTNHIQNNSPTSPTCSFVSGGGASPTCTVLAGSSDSNGVLSLNTGTGSPAATGNIQILFNTSFTAGHSAYCVFTAGGSGGGNWDISATFQQNSISQSLMTFNWFNNVTNLTASTSYQVIYFCFGI